MIRPSGLPHLPAHPTATVNSSSVAASAPSTRALSRVPDSSWLLLEHLAVPVHAGDQVSPVVGDEHLDVDVGVRQPGGDQLAESVDSGTGTGRDPDRPGQRPAQGQHVVLGHGVDLVDDDDLGNARGVDLAQHDADRLDLAQRVGVGAVDDVQQQIGGRHLLERGPEGVDELVRQVPHEPDGVGERVLPAVG